MPPSFISRIVAQRKGHATEFCRSTLPVARCRCFFDRRALGGILLRSTCLFGLCLGSAGCGPELDEAELGTIEYRLPEVPGAEAPYPLPDLTAIEDPEPAPENIENSDSQD